MIKTPYFDEYERNRLSREKNIQEANKRINSNYTANWTYTDYWGWTYTDYWGFPLDQNGFPINLYKCSFSGD